MKTHQHALLSASLGVSRSVCSLHFGEGGASRQKVYIQASLHADEMPGMLLTWHLKTALQTLEAAGQVRGEIVLVPQANPIGHDQTVLGMQQGRFDQATGENFNRHYAQLAQAIYPRIKDRLTADAAHNTRIIRTEMLQVLEAQVPGTTLQSLRRQLMLLAVDADVVLDLHCDYRAALHVYAATPLWSQCEPLARYLGSSVQLLSTDAGGAPFDEACGSAWLELQALVARDDLPYPVSPACLAVTLELRGQMDVTHANAHKDAEAILNFLRLRGVITDREAAPLPALLHPATPLAGSENLRAPHPGVVVFHVEPGAGVKPGETVAEIIDPISDRVTRLSSQYGGIVYTLENRHYATTGMWVAKVATDQAFKTGALLSD